MKLIFILIFSFILFQNGISQSTDISTNIRRESKIVANKKVNEQRKLDLLIAKQERAKIAAARKMLSEEKKEERKKTLDLKKAEKSRKNEIRNQFRGLNPNK